MLFTELGLSENTLKAIAERGYEQPTPIQAQAIPVVLTGRDLVGLAQTGTGKTAGFTLPMIEILSGGRARARMPRSLILTPTRELAAQIADNFDIYGKYHKLVKALLVGGTSMEEQVKILERGADVLIATPGRLLDLFERGKILLSDIKVLVIDEADRMLDMGFIPDIEKIVSKLSPMRQTLLFSATMPPEIQKLTQKFLSNPKQVSVAPPSSTSERVSQFIVWTDERGKKKLLSALIRRENVQNAFIFCNRKRDMDGLVKWLERDGFNVRAMHGDLDQKSRTQTLQDFKDDKVKLLVCSDVAARGLDVSGLSHVFNFDVPFNAEDYVHRIGRTGRAGKEGRAWMLATEDETKSVAAIEKLINKKIPVEIMDASPRARGENGDEGSGEKTPRPRTRPPFVSRRAPEERPQAGRARAPFTSERKRPPHTEEDAPSVVGFGEDVPGFLQKR